MPFRALQTTDDVQRWIDVARPQLFVLGDEVVAAADSDEMYHTIDALRELNLYRPPFNELCIDISAAALRRFLASDGRIDRVERVRALLQWKHGSEEPIFLLTAVDKGEHRSLDIDLEYGQRDPKCALAMWMLDLLIVCLAARNVVKSIKVTGGNASRRSPTRSFLNYTTLLLPLQRECEDDSEHPPTGAIMQPHLRRGHIRRQHYGAGNALMKQVWIAPVFVNADPKFVSNRRRYVVGSPTFPANASADALLEFANT